MQNDPICVPRVTIAEALLTVHQADTCHPCTDQRQSLNVIYIQRRYGHRRPSASSLRSWVQEFCSVCSPIKDEVVTANEPWFSSAAIEQTVGECRDDPSSSAQQSS
jgi:hypothetical protein